MMLILLALVQNSILKQSKRVDIISIPEYALSIEDLTRLDLELPRAITSFLNSRSGSVFISCNDTGVVLLNDF